MCRPVVCLLLASLLHCAGCVSQLSSAVRPSLDHADAAYAQLNLELSRQLLGRLLEHSDASAADKAGAEQRLARQDWKFHKDLTSARARLERADRWAEKRFATWSVLSRVEREAGHFDRAQAAAKTALQFAESQSDTKDAWMLWASAVLEQAVAAQKESSRYDREGLLDALVSLSQILDEEPGHREASALLLGVALLLDDGPSASKAWRFFYHIPEGASACGLMSGPSQTLERLLPTWKGRNLTRQEQEDLVAALVQSRFFRYAALVADKPATNSFSPLTSIPQVAEIMAYSDFLEKTKEITDEFYRLTALGRSSKAVYRKQWDEEARRLWQKLDYERRRPAFSRGSFIEQLERRFGAFVNFGVVDGYYGLAFGHRVIDETTTIRQYGHEAERSRGHCATNGGVSSWRPAAPSSSTRSVMFPPAYRRSCFGFSRSTPSSAWGTKRRFPSIFASLPPRTAP